MTELPLIDSDNDLIPVLRAASNEMLDPLVGYITDNGKGRVASKLDKLEIFKRENPRHALYADEIASEIQTFGANSIVSIVRGGKGVSYAEVVRDVANKLSVNYSKGTEVAAIEQQVLLKVLERAWEKMSDAERRELLEAVGVDYRGGIPKALPVVAIQAGIRLGGFMAYQIAVIVANAVAKVILGRGLSLAANATLARVLGIFAGPIGWAGTGLWTAFDIANPAYRVTVPCVVQVAAIRQEQIHKASIRICNQGHENPLGAAFCNTCGDKLG